MGQKVHPIGFRLGVIRTWDSKWFEERNYAQWLHEDIKIRAHVKKSLNHAGVSKVEIERAANDAHTMRLAVAGGQSEAAAAAAAKAGDAYLESRASEHCVFHVESG